MLLFFFFLKRQYLIQIYIKTSMGKIMWCPFQNSKSRSGDRDETRLVHELITGQAGDGTWGGGGLLYSSTFVYAWNFPWGKIFFPSILQNTKQWQCNSSKENLCYHLGLTHSHPSPQKRNKKDEGRRKQGKTKRKWEERSGREGRKGKKKTPFHYCL